MKRFVDAYGYGYLLRHTDYHGSAFDGVASKLSSHVPGHDQEPHEVGSNGKRMIKQQVKL